MTHFSRRSTFSRVPNELTQALTARRARGAPVLDLTESNPTQAGIPYDPQLLEALMRPDALRYDPQPFGLHAAREAVAKELGVDASRVVLTASTSEAYAFLFKLLADAEDEVLAPAPSYPLLEHLAQLEGLRLGAYRLQYDGAWHVDTSTLRSARAVLAVSPNNPTGSRLHAAELDALLEAGPVISDEVFGAYILHDRPGRVACAAASARRGLVFSLGGLSKLAALPQMKLAWMAVGGDAGLVEEALARLEVIADAFLSVGTPVMTALPTLLERSGASRDAILMRIRRNLGALDAALAGTTLTRLDLEGGWYATVRAPATRSEDALLLALLDEGVYVQPGSFFDFEQHPCLVLSLLTPEATFDAALPALVRVSA